MFSCVVVIYHIGDEYRNEPKDNSTCTSDSYVKSA